MSPKKITALTIVACFVGFLGLAAGISAAESGDEIHAALPQIPDRHFNIVDFGGVGDGRTMNTDAFKRAVAAVEKAGGGHLEVPAGTFLTLGFALTSHLDLHLDAGAVIKAPESISAWGLPDPATATQDDLRELPARPGFITGEHLTDIAITGSGTIDGSGQNFWIWSDKAARRYPPGRLIYPRATLVLMNGIHRMHVDGVTFTDSPMFHLSIRNNSQDLLFENIRIFAPSDAPNTDGIDPGGQRIIIRNCEIDTGDDHVAIQRGSRDVLIENLTCLHGHGISIGSNTVGGVSHMFVRNCTFDGSDNGLRIKSYRGHGGDVHDIHYSDITMKNVGRPIDINMLYNGNANAPTDIGPRQSSGESDNLPYFHDIHYTNITITRSPVAGRIIGLPEHPGQDIVFKNLSIQSDRGMLLQDAEGVVFDHVNLDVAVGKPIIADHATFKWTGSPEPK